MRIEKINTVRCRGGENPLWDHARQLLYFIDNSGRKLHCFDPASEATRSWDMPSVITTFVLRESGGAVVTLRSGIHFLDLETGAVQAIHPLPDPGPHVYNDGKVDRRGRFVIGACTPHFDNPTPDGGLFRLDPDLSLSRLDSGIHYSNSPCWAPDDKIFYFSDSYLNSCYAYDYDIDSGAVANRRVFADTTELGGMPDGSTVDRDGLVWMALFRGGKIAAFRPDGRIERIIPFPVSQVSSVGFGGADLDLLYVTTIADGFFGDPADDNAGHVYVIEGLGARGLPEPMFAG